MAQRRDTNGVKHGREKAMRTTSPLTAAASSATIFEYPIEVHQRGQTAAILDLRKQYRPPAGRCSLPKRVGYTRFVELV